MAAAQAPDDSSTATTRFTTIAVKHPSAVLLSVQLLSVLLFPLMEDTSSERAVFRILGLVVLGVVSRLIGLSVAARQAR